MYAPAFTQDPKRVARLQANYNEGRAREALSEMERRQLDIDALIVSPEKLSNLFSAAAAARAARKA
eukprot:CAMPEP_0176451034 /NCGR_PEP_ID=MMETSP0127-20121128/27543_1 /TAXON_ID=938130 /ORGANISM="Platyophrya macrostoma, Strain WH" /LENGTH=65 /DNA_ID=CAMNT_0017838907 /DNA_START=66 /DNA_END=263 /DNA_ORIENTATION=+